MIDPQIQAGPIERSSNLEENLVIPCNLELMSSILITFYSHLIQANKWIRNWKGEKLLVLRLSQKHGLHLEKVFTGVMAFLHMELWFRHTPKRHIVVKTYLVTVQSISTSPHFQSPPTSNETPIHCFSIESTNRQIFQEQLCS